MTARAKCRVEGCPGRVELTTNGAGRVVDDCPCCAKRKTWAARNLPRPKPLVCAICTGTFGVRAPGRGKAKKYCPACEPLVQQRANARKGARRAA